MKKLILVFIFLVLFGATSALAKNSAKCDALQSTPEAIEYDTKVTDLDAKSEDLLITMGRIIQARRAADTQALEKIAEVIEGKIEGLSKLNPPTAIEDLHQRHIKAYGAMEEAARVELEGEEDFVSIVHKCYQAQLEFFETFKAIAVENECDEGDIEALENEIIPAIKRLMNEKFPL